MCESLLLVPEISYQNLRNGIAIIWFKSTNQLAAITGFDNILFLDFGFSRTLGVDERFFFFCNSRPIINSKYLNMKATAPNPSGSFDKSSPPQRAEMVRADR